MKEYHNYSLPETEKEYYRVGAFGGIDALNPDDTLPLSAAKYCYNVRVFNGRLRQSFGVDYASCNGSYLPSAAAAGSMIYKAAVYSRYDYVNSARDDRVMMLLYGNKIYQTGIGTSLDFGDTGITMSSGNVIFLNFHCNGKDCLYITDDNGMSYFYDGTDYRSLAATPKFSSLCVHNRKVYGTASENQVRFSEDYNPLEWSDTTKGAGCISFPDEYGAMRKIISFNGYLYVFRDYAVYKLAVYDDITDYTLTRIMVTDAKIYGETVAVCGDRIIFLTERGFMSYNGNTISVVWRDMFPMIDDKTYAAGAYFDGKYYISAKFATEGETVGDEAHCNYNNGILACDLDADGATFVRGADVAEFLPCHIGEKSYLFMRNSTGYRSAALSMPTEDGKIYGEHVKRLWRSPACIFDTEKDNKTVGKFYIRANADINVALTLDKTYSFGFSAQNGTQCVTVGGNAETVRVEISTEADSFSVNGFSFELEKTERRLYNGN
jgi:hypothetical protein